MERAAADAAGDQGAHAAFVPVALRDDAAAETGREGADFKMGRRALDLVQQAQHVGGREVAEARGEVPAILSRGGERLQQAIERSVLAEEQDLVLAAKVVIEVAGGEIGGDRDVAHAGRGEAAVAERARRGLQDVEPARLGAS